MTTVAFPYAHERIRAAIEAGTLRSGAWGDGNAAVCMMSAMEPTAANDGGIDACVTAGWPKWLADLNVYLFDAVVGADDENAARAEYALQVSQLVSAPRDMDRARDQFLIARLDTGEHSALKTLRAIEGDWTQQIEAVETVVSLLRRRLNGEDVAAEMRAAYAAAYAAADAAANAAYAAYAAARAARAAADAAYAARAAADAAADAAYAARAAARAAADAAAYAAARAARAAADAAADAAANAAARADLIAALREAAA